MRQFSYQRAEFLLVFNINLITVFSFFHVSPPVLPSPGYAR